MAKIISFIMTIFTALYMFVSCGKIPGKGDGELTASTEISVTEPASGKEVSISAEESQAWAPQAADSADRALRRTTESAFSYALTARRN